MKKQSNKTLRTALKVWKWRTESVRSSGMSDSVRPGSGPCLTLAARLSCSWCFPGKTTGVGCCSFLQGTFSAQGSHPGLLQSLYSVSQQGSPAWITILWLKILEIPTQTSLNNKERINRDFSVREAFKVMNSFLVIASYSQLPFWIDSHDASKMFAEV